ncbi:glyceraldehyde-3-phosphate dehydrogenase/erythrose-4-phosphate dehydrogenase [Pelotomaculum thermopropionicum SI]|uniref:Glyceraldehyde-3-phosphate dehydrogenase n=1 Tax=Pelotomaculum thermopropionicum (strain DSM 13744 / JCM 10971 / SI) TaxID=370438 RepID=A5CYN9_PELTS|nr:glyceraldehyde-3-phosphate dehydrogenase/erythrose-4-phosphate dehydrogenase [Pelotomaculum thermopropionicum SI]
MGCRIGINGLGRIGRDVLRGALKRPDLEVVAVNHKSRRIPVSDDYARSVAHMVKYDSIHGTFDLDVQSEDGAIVVNGRKIRLLAEGDPLLLPWKELGVDIVVESTGRFNNPDEAAKHLEAGARKVILSAPAKGGECLTVVMGVNHEKYDPAVHHVVSNASCTTNCLAPVAKVLNDRFGIVKGLMTTVHAYTNDQQLLDMPHRDMRRARAANMSIIPTTTGAARAVALVLPELKGKLNGFAMRVPVPNVSVVDLVVELARPASADEINRAFKEASQGHLKGILDYCELPLVSIDFNGNPYSAVVDALSTMVIDGNMAKVIAWYDNEWGYSQRILDMASYMAAKGW